MMNNNKTTKANTAEGQKRIYLDNNATTPVDPRVLEAMLPYFTEKFGNAASIHHSFGWEAQDAVEEARVKVASLIGAKADEIIFTSGATESNNLAIKGIAFSYQEKGRHIITCKTEHKAVLDPCKWLESKGFEVTYLPVDRYGLLDPDDLKAAIRRDTILVTIMTVNNETGVIHPIDQIAAVCKEKGVIFHTDATQAYGKLPIDVEELKIDLLSFSAHKIYGPKGIGGLYVRKQSPRIRCEPIIHGGGHERGMRSGTLNVPGIVGLGKAAEIAKECMHQESERIKGLRDMLYQGLINNLEGVYLNGHPERRIYNTVNLSFKWVEGEALMLSIGEIAVSSGSACTSASLEPSHVLKAMNVPEELAHNSIRFSLGRFNTEEQIKYTIERVTEAVQKLRELSPLPDLEGKEK